MIIFSQPKLHTSISNRQPHRHTFEGFNNSNLPVKITKVTKGCSCTNVVYPEVIQPNEKFGIVVDIDKTGQIGLFSVGLAVEFDNGDSTQTIKLNINGSLVDK